LEQISVAEPHHIRWLVMVDAALLGSLLILVGIGWSTDHNGVDAVIAVLILGIFMAFWYALRSTCHSRAYRNGYLDGRQMMIASMTEAMMRGMTPEEWVRTEVERDQKVIEHI
jgi:hypothetical protein